MGGVLGQVRAERGRTGPGGGKIGRRDPYGILTLFLGLGALHGPSWTCGSDTAGTDPRSPIGQTRVLQRMTLDKCSLAPSRSPASS